MTYTAAKGGRSRCFGLTGAVMSFFIYSQWYKDSVVNQVFMTKMDIEAKRLSRDKSSLCIIPAVSCVVCAL